jgi:prepilin-type N-terminal cleavage/methylation domain-containing protein
VDKLSIVIDSFLGYNFIRIINNWLVFPPNFSIGAKQGGKIIMHINNKRSEGFTLVELLVVIAIIGLLSTLSLVALNSARQKARDALRTADIKQMQTALELYYSDNSSYPIAGTQPGNGKFFITGALATGTANYMGLIPSNPTPLTDGACSNTASHEFIYTQDNGGASYHISYCLAGGSGGIIKGPHIATPSGVANP